MHKYSLGQTVRYSGEAGLHQDAGDYEIVRLLPENTAGERQYRLRKTAGTAERVVREHQLTVTGGKTAI